MTLNILAYTREAVYLSGDFRITYTRDGSHKDDLNAQKLVPVIKFGWVGLISFCGVAQTAEGRPVGDWIAAQVQAHDSKQRVRDIAGRLLGAQSWLGKFQKNKRHFSMSFVGLDRRRPFFYFFSNFQTQEGLCLATPFADLKESFLRPTLPDVRSYPSPIQAEEKEAILQAIIPRGSDASNVIADINARAASRDQTISRQCVVGRVHVNGSGTVKNYNIDPNTTYAPGYVLREMMAAGVIGFKGKLDEAGHELPVHWRGGAYTLARLDDGRDVVSSSHAFANVSEPIAGPKKGAGTVFWKIAEEGDQPPTFEFGPRTRRDAKPA